MAESYGYARDLIDTIKRKKNRLMINDISTFRKKL